MTGGRFDASRAKIRRANEHLRSLDAELHWTTENKAYAIARHVEDTTGQEIVDIQIARTTELRWATMVGDVVHNLRSALDYAICTLIRVENPMADCVRSPSYPLYKTALRDDERRSELVDVPAEARAIIELHQPHANPTDPARDPLWHLHELSNRDKHREPSFFGRVLTVQYEVEGIYQPLGVKSWTDDALKSWADGTVTPTINVFQDGTRVFRYAVPKLPDVKAQRPASILIAFEEPADLRGAPVSFSLMHMQMAVESTIEDLIKAFP